MLETTFPSYSIEQHIIIKQYMEIEKGTHTGSPCVWRLKSIKEEKQRNLRSSKECVWKILYKMNLMNVQYPYL